MRVTAHKRMLAVVVRREQDGQTQYEKHRFGATRCEIASLAAWLQHQQVSEGMMESTAQYWRPVWYGLEGHFQLHLTHPLRRERRGVASEISATRSGWRTGGGPEIWRRASFRTLNSGPGAG